MSLDQFPVVIDVRVSWGQMDAFNHVNNIVYFRYFEDVRISYFERVKLMQSLEEHQIGPILAHTECKYKGPVTYPDTLKVGARVTELNDTEIRMEYAVVSNKTGRVVAEGKALVVSFDFKAQKRAPLPDDVRQEINKLERCDCV